MTERQRRLGLVVTATLSLAFAGQAWAGEKIFHLKNGRSVRGVLVVETSTHYVIAQAGGEVRLARGLVARVEDAVTPAPRDASPPRTTTPSTGNTAAPASPKTSPPALSGGSPGAEASTDPDPGRPARRREGRSWSIDPDGWLVAEPGRLREDVAPADPGRATAAFRAALDATLSRGETDPEVMASAVRRSVANAQTDGDRLYVVYRAETHDDPVVRTALWKAWLALQAPGSEEVALLRYAGSDVQNARVHACELLARHATWERSFPLLRRLLDTEHTPSHEVAVKVMVELCRRAPFPSAAARLAVEGAVARRGGWSALLANVASTRDQNLARAIEAAFRSARDPGTRAGLLTALLESLPAEEAGDRLRVILHDVSEEGRALWRFAITELPLRAGRFEDIPLLLERLEDPSGPALTPLQLAILASSARLAGRASRFDSVEQARAWWAVVEPIYEQRARLIEDLSRDGDAAVAAMGKLGPVLTEDVSEAFRGALRSRDERVRSVALEAVVQRRDFGAVPRLLELLSGELRDRVLSILNSLAGEALPDDASAIERWWHERHPELFAR